MSTAPTPTTPKTAGEMVQMARAFLERKGVDEARLESELIVGHALTLTRLQLFMQLDRPITKPEIDAARDLLVRRGKREPVAYITGEREFYGRSFHVGTGVLVPRPETEHVVDRAREIAKERAKRSDPVQSIADVGTGSACIAVTLALEVPTAKVDGIDISRAALAYARDNATRLGATVEFHEGEGFVTLTRLARERGRGFDLVCSNPPYIPQRDRTTLEPEVRDHEPELALFVSDADPDSFVRRFLAERRDWLAPGGTVLVELGHDQAPRVRALAADLGVAIRIHRDYSGHDRVLEILSVVA